MPAAEISQTGRRVRRRPSRIQRWLPTVIFGFLVTTMVVLFAALRILSQAPEQAQSALVPVVEAPAPVAEVAVAVASASVPAPAVPGETTTGQGGIRFSVRQIDASYTVVSGDSLYSVAQRHNTTAEALQGINNLPDTMLSVGQRLVIP